LQAVLVLTVLVAVVAVAVQALSAAQEQVQHPTVLVVQVALELLIHTQALL
jgi:hypothetical protein